MQLLGFFKTYRAHVRGKVTSFRLNNPALTDDERRYVNAEASAYFQLAHDYATGTLPRPAIYLVAGLMGTGKSSIAEELARRWDMRYISSDLTRKRLAGVDTGEHRY